MKQECNFPDDNWSGAIANGSDFPPHVDVLKHENISHDKFQSVSKTAISSTISL